MLSNPHWDAPSFSSFEHWLEGKDPQERYSYSNGEICACAQYLKAVGKFDKRWLAKAGIDDTVHKMNRLAAGHFEMGYGHDGHTYGELLDRVRKHRQLVNA